MNDLGLHLITGRRREIARELDRLRAEDEELAAAEKALARLGAQNANSANFVGGGLAIKAEGGSGTGARARSDRRRSSGKTLLRSGASRNEARAQPKTQRDLLLDALAHADAIWLNTNDLLAEVERRTGERLPAPSIRPILTQLKIEGTIVRKKRLIAMADRSKKGNAQQRRQ